MSVHGLAFVDQPVTNGIANIEVARQGGDHSFTAGIYYSDYTTRLKLLQQGVFLEVADNPRSSRWASPGQNGAFTGLTPPDGFAGYNSGFWNLRNHTTRRRAVRRRLVAGVGPAERRPRRARGPQLEPRAQRAAREPGHAW